MWSAPLQSLITDEKVLSWGSPLDARETNLYVLVRNMVRSVKQPPTPFVSVRRPIRPSRVFLARANMAYSLNGIPRFLRSCRSADILRTVSQRESWNIRLGVAYDRLGAISRIRNIKQGGAPWPIFGPRDLDCIAEVVVRKESETVIWNSAWQSLSRIILRVLMLTRDLGSLQHNPPRDRGPNIIKSDFTADICDRAVPVREAQSIARMRYVSPTPIHWL